MHVFTVIIYVNLLAIIVTYNIDKHFFDYWLDDRPATRLFTDVWTWSTLLSVLVWFVWAVWTL